MISRQQALLGTETLLLVALGAFGGANGRYFISLLIDSTLMSTAVVNIIGSFALGALTQEAQLVGIVSRRSHRILGTGFLSSFTTYSSFVIDAVTATPALGVLYILGSYVLGFTGAILGHQTVLRLSTADTVGSEA